MREERVKRDREAFEPRSWSFEVILGMGAEPCRPSEIKAGRPFRSEFGGVERAA